jgi:hypothetical protein
MPSKSDSVRAPALGTRKLTAVPDTVDFRDEMFSPTLIRIPPTRPLETYLEEMGDALEILDQGSEGACTGFALAAVANYMLWTGGRIMAPGQPDRVSPWMLYRMAQRYDEWPGEDYDGSSARGAMKAWHKHGVCGHAYWCGDHEDQDGDKWSDRWLDAVRRPLGAYYRVNHKDIVAMHAAIVETGILYATAAVHTGWDPDRVEDGLIDYSAEPLGGHAFAIVGYDEEGFWIQNSWGDDWGRAGFARLTYDDWLRNGNDVWVAALGAPIRLGQPEAAAGGIVLSSGTTRSYVFSDLRGHVISIGNDGAPRTSGTYGTDEDDIEEIFSEHFPAFEKRFRERNPDTPVHLLLYAHGGLVDESSAIQRVAEYRAALLDRGVYPVAFIWKTDFWSTLTNILRDAVRSRRSEGFLDDAKDFMLDRLDDGLEPVARLLGGKSQWDEMKENALLSTTSAGGGARVAAAAIAKHLGKRIGRGRHARRVHLHLVGHSAGSIFMAPLARLLTSPEDAEVAFDQPAGHPSVRPAPAGHGLAIHTCTLWAPACTVDLFRSYYQPIVDDGGIRRFSLFTLTDEAERDDHCANVYHKSLLYLVSNAFEDRPRIPLVRNEGTPILGMALGVDDELRGWFYGLDARADWIRSPNTAGADSDVAARSRSHGGFDDDPATLQATLRRILAAPAAQPSEASRELLEQVVEETFSFERSPSRKRDIRRELAERSQPAG